MKIKTKTEKETRDERVARLKRERAAILGLLKEGQPDPETGKPGRGNPNIVEYGKSSQWPKGTSGNPGGKGRNLKKHLRFWKQVSVYLGWLYVDVERLEPDELTVRECGARKFALCVAKGNWLHMKEVIDRELGRPKEGGSESEVDDRPKLIKLPFGIMKGSQNE